MLPVAPAQVSHRTQACVGNMGWQMCVPSAAPGTISTTDCGYGRVQAPAGGKHRAGRGESLHHSDTGTGGQGIPSSDAKRSCSSPGKPFPGAQGEGKPPVGHSKPSAGMGSSASGGFPIPGSPQNHWSQVRKTPAGQAVGTGSGSAPGWWKNNPRGVRGGKN